MKVMLKISHTPLSIARYSGGAKVNGQEYVYIRQFDALILKSLVKPYNKFKKERNGQKPGDIWAEFIDHVKKDLI